MRELKLNRAFTLIEPGPVVLARIMHQARYWVA
jgi:hypothetical protein